MKKLVFSGFLLAFAFAFFNTAMLRYRLYKNYFPIWALGLYEKLGSMI